MSRPPLWSRVLLGAGVLTVVAVILGLTLGGGDPAPSDRSEPSATPTVAPSTPLADVDTTSLTVARDAFCDDVDPVQVYRALALKDDTRQQVDLTGYENGQRADLTDSVNDVAHEFGCTWDARGVRARAWVFAPPITTEQASGLVGLAKKVKGCTPVAAPASFGQPSTALTCDTARGPQVSYRGLFGDAWLTCTLTEKGADKKAELAERADRWCAAVALAASD